MVRPFHRHLTEDGVEISGCNCSTPNEPFDLERHEKELSRAAGFMALAIVACWISIGIFFYVAWS